MTGVVFLAMSCRHRHRYRHISLTRVIGDLLSRPVFGLDNVCCTSIPNA